MSLRKRILTLLVFIACRFPRQDHQIPRGSVLHILRHHGGPHEGQFGVGFQFLKNENDLHIELFTIN